MVWMGWHLKNWRHGRQVTAPKWSPVSWRPEGALLTPSSEGWGGMGPHTAHTPTILVFFSEKISLDVYPKGQRPKANYILGYSIVWTPYQLIW